MLVEFDTLPEESRVWIYQANRSFSETEISEINEKLKVFIEAWTAHGQDLQSGFKVVYKRFIVIALNQNLNAATGCSIDASVHFIQQFLKKALYLVRINQILFLQLKLFFFSKLLAQLY